MTPDRLPRGSTRSLDGTDWEAHGYLGEEWRFREGHTRRGRERDWLRATVPGSVLEDVRSSGVIPDPYVGRNSLLAEWVPERTWLYRKRFELPRADLAPRVQLRLEGVDYSGQVFLNGERLGAQEGTFVPAAWDVRHALRPGEENLLAVVLDPVPLSEPQVGRTERVRVHKPRMSYGWDFCPRAVHLGIWDSVTLHGSGPARIADAWVRGEPSGDRGARVRVEVALDGPAALVAVAIDDGPLRLADASATAGGSHVHLELALQDAPRWWSNGLGSAACLRATIRALDADGGLSDERTVTFGVRSVQLVANDGAPRDALPYTLLVNGRRTPIRGWNWVPLDLSYGPRRPQRLARLLDLAWTARVNVLRVWGGGLIERDDFYDACDERGILVWQEFSQSSSGISSVPANDPEFVERMRREAEQIVPRRRNHPSLAIWGGGKELTHAGGLPIDERHPVISALAETVRSLDPGRAWLPSSPSGRAFLNRLDLIEADPDAQHDVHGPWEHQGPAAHYGLYNAGTSLLHSEFGAEGMTNATALRAVVPPGERWPADRTNPTYEHLGAWWNNAASVVDWFGGDAFRAELEGMDEDSRLDTLRRCSQLLQADGLRYAVESGRRRWPRSAGTLPWQLNEPFPNAWCTSAVDYLGRPKPAWWAVAEAYAVAPVGAVLERQVLARRATLRVQPWTHVEHEIREPLPLAFRVRVYDPTGACIAEHTEHVSVTTGVTHGERVELTLPGGDNPTDGVLTLEISLVDRGARTATSTRYLLSRTGDLAPLRTTGPTRLTVECSELTAQDAWTVRVTSAGELVAVGAEIEDTRPADASGWPEFGAVPWFHLLPGEQRTIPIQWRDAPRAERQLRISAWNAPATLVRGGGGTPLPVDER